MKNKDDITKKISEIDKELEHKKQKFDEIKNMIITMANYDTVSIRMELRRLELEISGLETDRKKLCDRLYESEVETIGDSELERKQLTDDDLVYLDELVVYLKIADMSDLALRLSNLRYAFRTYDVDDSSKSDKSNKSNRAKVKVGKKEHDEIKKGTIRLSKLATKVAKTYKDLYMTYNVLMEIIAWIAIVYFVVNYAIHCGIWFGEKLDKCITKIQ